LVPKTLFLICLLLLAAGTSITAGKERSGLGGFFASLEFGRPILGVRIPFSWINPDWKEGTIEIAEASLQPGGSGLWKLAVQPDLVLKGVILCGREELAGKALQALRSKGIYSMKIVSFSYRPNQYSETVHWQEVWFNKDKVIVSPPGVSQEQKRLIAKIFGKEVAYKNF